jgi:hypothetical protein
MIVTNRGHHGVTDEAGTVSIAKVPPGRHKVAVWHETLGVLQQEVTIPAGGEATVTFTYEADAIGSASAH